MSHPAPFINRLGSVLPILAAIVNNRLPEGEARKEVIKTLRMVCRTTRFLQAHTVSTIQGSVWDKVRPSTATVDFLLDVTFDLSLTLAQSEYPMPQLHADIAFATCQFGSQSKEQVMDQELASRLATNTWHAELLKLHTTNPWLTTLRLLDMQINQFLPDSAAA